MVFMNFAACQNVATCKIFNEDLKSYNKMHEIPRLVIRSVLGSLRRFASTNLFLLAFLALTYSLTETAKAQDVDWLVSITDGNVSPPAGGVVAYQISVTNSGADPAPATTISIAIPAATSFDSFTGAFTGCSPAPIVAGPATIVCNVPVLAPDAVVGTVFNVRSSVQGTFSVQASVPIAGDSDSGNNVSSDATTVVAGADIALALTGPTSAAAGSIQTFNFVATNNGPDAVSSIIIDVPVPTGFGNIAPPVGCVQSGTNFQCTIAGPIAVGASVTRSFTGQITASTGSTVTMTGTVSSSVPTDPDSANNTALISTSVTAGSDVSIAKSRTPSGEVFVGDTVTFTLAAQYTGDDVNGIVITDTIPANYSITSAVGAGYACTLTGQLVRCTRTSGSGPGENVSLGSITVVTTAISAGTPTNTASITTSAPVDPNTGNNTATDGGATITLPTADLQANKSGPNPALAVVGNSYNFDISTTNLGNRPFVGTLQMTDNLPAGLTLTAAALNGWTCSPAPTVAGPVNVVCTRVYTVGAPLAVGETSPPVTLTTLVTATGALNNGLTVASPNPNFPDPNVGNNTITVGLTSSAGGASADLSVLKSAGLATVVVGDVETFTLQIVNSGPSTSSSISVNDDVTNLINSATGLTGAGFISAVVTPNSATGATCAPTPSGGTSVQLNCSIATLPLCTVNVNCPTILVTVRPGGNAGSRSNTARAISSVTADPNLGNNAATANYAVTARTDVTVSKTAPANAAAGQNVTYVVTASSIANGLSSADAVTITDTLPSDVTFISASPSSGSCGTTPAPNAVTGIGSNQVICNLGTISNGAQQTVVITVRPNNATRGTSITNNVSVTTTTPETDAGNNSASAVTAIGNPAFDLRMDKTETVDPVAVGDDTVYVLSVLNAGPSAVENMVVTDPLPAAGLSFQSVTAVGGVCTGPAVNSIGGTVTCNFGPVTSGGTRTVNITMRGVTKGSYTNTATVAADISGPSDTVPGNNTESETTTVRTRVNLEVTSKTATPGTVNLRDPFSYVIVVRNLVGPLLAESDGTFVNDTLPAGMQLAGTPSVAINTGSATISTCTGAAGGTSFSCNLGTFSNGGQATITVPVRVISVSSLAQVFTNTATIVTTSRDIVTDNNTNSGPVTVQSSSISGTVFRDFNNNALITPAADTGVGGVSLTLTGTATDGTILAPITVQTLADGTYNFPLLPAGTYSITRGTVSEAYLTNGTSTAGPNGGNAGGVIISAITLPGATAAPGYLFPLIPQARIGLAKAVIAGPTVGADGSFTVTFRMTVRNPSLEALNTIALTDPLQGASPLFGTFAALGTPATDPLALGSYTILTAPSGSCGGTNGGFNGAGNATLASGFTLASGASCTVDVALRVQPTTPIPPVLPSGGRYDNQATVDGVGALSGQTSATNPQLRDLSDNGVDTDANSNGQSNEAGENDPTPVLPLVTPSIALVKTANVSGLTTPPLSGQTVVFSFAVTNTGNVTLNNITITDALVGLTNAPSGIASLAPGATATATLTGSYVLLQSDIDAGTVRNTATVNATDPFATPVSDISGTATTNDTSLDVPLGAAPSITLVKAANATGVTSPAQVGQTITYSFTVQNTGNVTLTNVSITDVLPGIVLAGGPVTLTPGQVDSATFAASYVLTQADLDAGQVQNSATVSGTPPSGAAVTDVSGSSSTNNTPTTVPLAQSAAITLVKTVDATSALDGVTVGDALIYAFSITNTGNVSLKNVTITDILPGIVLTGGPIAVLAPGQTDSTTITASYSLVPADVVAARVDNTATVTGSYGPGNTLSTTAASSATATLNDPSIALVKRADTSGITIPATAGQTLVYRFDVTNTGNVSLTNITITDVLLGLTNAPSGITSLAPGATATAPLTANYVLLQSDVDLGTVENTATVDAVDPLATPVTDISGTATNNDTPLVVPLTPVPSITLVKSANATGVTSPAQVGQTISYSFSVQNTGNVTLTNVGITDVLPGIVLAGAPVTLIPGQINDTTFTGSYVLTQADIDAGLVQNSATVSGTPPSGPAVTDVSGSNATNDTPTTVPLAQGPAITLVKTVDDSAALDGASVGELLTYAFTVTNTGNVTLNNVTISDVLPGIVLSGGPITLAPGQVDSTSFTATYALVATDITTGTVLNTATATGLYGPGNTLSTTANSSATANVLSVFANPEPYPPFTTDGGTTTSILASDIFSGGQATLANVTITVLGTSDPGITLNPATGLITLAPGLPAGPYTVTYQICTILAPTVCSTTTETVYQAPVGRIETTKTQTVTENGDGVLGVGDTVTYTITVQNLSNTSVTNITLADTLTAIDGAAQTLDTGPSFVSADQGSVEGTLLINEIATYTSSKVLTVDVVTRGGLRNTVTARGDTVVPPGPPPSVVSTPVSDVSDNGIDNDGNVVDDPNVLIVSPSLAPSGLTVTKTTPRGVVTRGSVVPYTITIRNDNPFVSGQLNIVDVLPPGLIYVDGSAALDGTPYVVTVQGRVVTFPNVPVPPLTTVVATIQTRVTTGAQAGELVNRATLRDPATNTPLAPTARATVRILPEAVFDCGDVIGKVFDDRNRDGYQNAPRPVELGNPDAIGGGGKYGKYGGAPAVESDDGKEPGIPAVRLAGVDGTIITTDQFGRFHLPCAMLPADRGSNFILKLDTRSLPSGYRLTTDNPSVVRLTPGKMTEMNFGVAISKVVRVDLAANAFVTDSDGNAALSDALKNGITTLLPKITGEAVTLHLAYHLPRNAEAADVKRARNLMALVKRHVAREWADVGRTKLTVEMTTVRSDE